MLLEATIIWVHKSERMRNQDDPPSRFEKQADAFAILCAAKTQAKETTLGVLAMAAGKGVGVFVTPSYDKVLFGQQIGGEANLTAAIWVSQLSLLNMDEEQILQQAQQMSIKDFTCGELLDGVTDQPMSGMYEALDLWDGGSGYLGKGVLKDPTEQFEIDNYMVQQLDGTSNEWGWCKQKLGANVILAVSLAVRKAGAIAKKISLYQHIANLAGNKTLVLHGPTFIVINGGSHAGNKLSMEVQKAEPVVKDETAVVVSIAG